MSWSNLAEDILEDFVDVARDAASHRRRRFRLMWTVDLELRRIRDQAWERQHARHLRLVVPTLAPSHLASCVRCRADLEQRPGTKVLAAHKCKTRTVGVIPISPKQA